jgi:hypothetical protein
MARTLPRDLSLGALLGTVLASATAPCAAQTPIFLPIQLSDRTGGNTVTYAIRALPLAPGDTAFQQDLTADPVGVPDVVFQSWWYWSEPVSGTSEPLHLGTRTPPVMLAQTASSVILHWPDIRIDPAGRTISASLRLTAKCQGPVSGYVEQEVLLVNTTRAPVSLKLYLYNDFDYGTSGGDATGAFASAHRHIVGDATMPGCAELFSQLPSHWEIGVFPSVRDRVVAGADLADTGLPSGPGDIASAVQWNVVLAPAGTPAGSFYSFAVLGHNSLYGTTPSRTFHYGSGSGTGIHLTTRGAPVPGAPLEIGVIGPPSAPATLLIGESPTYLGLSGCKQALLVSAFAQVTLHTDATGSGRLVLPAVCNPAGAGYTAYFQAFFLDPSAACLPLAHSDGLATTWGR